MTIEIQEATQPTVVRGVAARSARGEDRARPDGKGTLPRGGRGERPDARQNDQNPTTPITPTPPTQSLSVRQQRPIA